MKNYGQEHELARRAHWSAVWAATASANDCKSHEIATRWADHALTAFDKRFPPLADTAPGDDE